MLNSESWERIDHGLQRAASCCREMCILTKVNDWVELSKQFLLMRQKAKAMYLAAPLTEVEVMALVAEMEMAQKLAGLMRAQGG